MIRFPYTVHLFDEAGFTEYGVPCRTFYQAQFVSRRYLISTHKRGPVPKRAYAPAVKISQRFSWTVERSKAWRLVCRQGEEVYAILWDNQSIQLEIIGRAWHNEAPTNSYELILPSSTRPVWETFAPHVKKLIRKDPKWTAWYLDWKERHPEKKTTGRSR